MPRSARFFRLLAILAATTASGQSQLTPATGTQAPVQTLKANAQLVIVDVIVTDSKQTPIHNLKPSDFTVLENGAPQQITSFEEHVAPPLAQTAKVPPMRPLPAGIFTNFTPVRATGPVNVLLLDALNTQMKDQSYVHNQLVQFLKNTPAGTRIAIFVLNDQLTMLQGFTSDLTLLKSVVDRTVPGSSKILGDSTGNHDSVGNGGTAPPSQVMDSISGGDLAQLISSVQQAEAVQAATDTQNRALQTLQAMNQLAHFLAGIPGRKNLIWCSGSFPLTIFPDSTIARPFAVVASMEDEFRQTTSLLARSQVAVYPIDASGLKFLGAPIAVDSGPASSGIGLTMAQNKLFQDNANDHATMYQMAADTGGHAYLDTNGLSEAVANVIDSSSNYYTLSYTPTATKQDGKFHKIQVKLAQPGLNLAYRKGYYADDAQDLANRRSDDAGAPASGRDTLAHAMMRGAPDATEILLKLQVIPASAAIETAAVKGNVINPNPAAKVKIKGPYHRYAIDVAADAGDIKITPTPDGRYQFSTELITYVYDAAGAVINVAAQKAQGNLSISNYANLRRVGLQFHQEVSVPVAGEYYLRTSLRDLDTDRYGSVEIPVASVAKLSPLTAAATTTPAAPR